VSKRRGGGKREEQGARVGVLKKRKSRKEEGWSSGEGARGREQEGEQEQQQGALNKRGSNVQDVKAESKKWGGEKEWGAGRTGSMEQEGE
jgi:hypothetical protein